MLEVFSVRSLVLRPESRSVRRARLVQGNKKLLDVPAQSLETPFALPRPKIFIIRSLGTENPHKLHICPSGVAFSREVGPYSVFSEFTWTFDSRTTPVTSLVTFRNTITGQFLGQAQLDAEMRSKIPAIMGSIGENFELTFSQDRTCTYRRRGFRTEIYYKGQGLEWHKIAENDPQNRFFALSSTLSSETVIKELMNILFQVWLPDRYSSIVLLQMINRYLEQRRTLGADIHIQAIKAILQKISVLTLFLDHFLKPLEMINSQKGLGISDLSRAICLSLQMKTELTTILDRVSAFDEKLILKGIAADLTECIPLEEKWWSQIAGSIPKSDLDGYCEQLKSKAITWLQNRADVIGPVQNWTLKPGFNLHGGHLGKLRQICEDLWVTLNSSLLQQNSVHLMHPKDSGNVDVVSLLRQLHIPSCTTFPWVELHTLKPTLWAAVYPDLYYRKYSEFRQASIKKATTLCYSDEFRAVKIIESERTKVDWKLICYSTKLEESTGPRQISNRSSVGCLEGQADIDPKKEAVTSNSKPYIVQVAAGKRHIFLLRGLGYQAAVVMIPMFEKSSPTKLLDLLTPVPRTDKLKYGRPLLAMESAYAEDPRQSHPFAYIEKANTLLIAESTILCPVSELHHQKVIDGDAFHAHLADTTNWVITVRLNAIAVTGDEMIHSAETILDFAIPQSYRMMCDLFSGYRWLGQQDVIFQFRWKFHARRIFGIWIRDRQASTIFVLLKNRFVIAAQQQPKKFSLLTMDELVSTSIRGHGLPILNARCVSWLPDEHIRFEITLLKFKL